MASCSGQASGQASCSPQELRQKLATYLDAAQTQQEGQEVARPPPPPLTQGEGDSACLDAAQIPTGLLALDDGIEVSSPDETVETVLLALDGMAILRERGQPRSQHLNNDAREFTNKYAQTDASTLGVQADLTSMRYNWRMYLAVHPRPKESSVRAWCRSLRSSSTARTIPTDLASRA